MLLRNKRNLFSPCKRVFSSGIVPIIVSYSIPVVSIGVGWVSGVVVVAGLMDLVPDALPAMFFVNWVISFCLGSILGIVVGFVVGLRLKRKFDQKCRE